MIGAIAGDIIGSVHEMSFLKRMNFELFQKNSRFTDDTVMTMAVAKSILERSSYRDNMHDFGNRYPDRGYGGMFRKWLAANDKLPYDSWGNGGAMRVSPVGFAFNNIKLVLEEAEYSSNPTHNHSEGIKGSKAIAACVFLARTGSSKTDIKKYVEKEIGSSLKGTIGSIRKNYKMDVSSAGSVPPAIIAFLESNSFENAIRLAVSLGGDADTQACMAGVIAQAYYKEIPEEIYHKTMACLSDEFKEILNQFENKYNINYKLI